MNITKQYSPTRASVFRALLEVYNITQRGKRYYFWVFGLIGLILALRLYNGQSVQDPGIFGFPLWGEIAGFLFVVFCVVPGLIYWATIYAMDGCQSLKHPQNWEITENAIRIRGKGMEVNLEWSHILHVKQGKRFLLFFISRNNAFFLPIGILSQDEIKQILTFQKI